jgi:hypothetical protein
MSGECAIRASIPPTAVADRMLAMQEIKQRLGIADIQRFRMLVGGMACLAVACGGSTPTTNRSEEPAM